MILFRRSAGSQFPPTLGNDAASAGGRGRHRRSDRAAVRRQRVLHRVIASAAGTAAAAAGILPKPRAARRGMLALALGE